MEVIGVILAWIFVALLFSLAVFIHEFGHFLAARWLGLRIEAFSIGFGPALWKKKSGGVEYRIGSVPFGGYVALPQLDPSGMEKIQGKPKNSDAARPDRGKPSQEDIAPWRRMIVAFAGPFGNVVLAALLAFLIAVVPGAKTGVIGTRVGLVDEDGDAWKAGLRTGDTILSVNGKAVETWTDFQTECLLAGTLRDATLGVLRQGKKLNLSIPLSTNNVLGATMLAGILPEADMACVIGGVMKDTPAERAGLLAGDLVASVNGEAVHGSAQFVKQIGTAKTHDVKLRVLRDRKSLEFSVTPAFKKEIGRSVIGVLVETNIKNTAKAWMMYRNPWKQLKWDAMSVVRVLAGLIHPKRQGERAAIAKNIGGPVAIMVGLYRTVRGSTWDALGFLRMICVNLAILNLLPIPVLDGGHMLFGLYEVLTRRKPHPKVMSVLVNACAILLLALMVLLVYRDIARQVTFSRIEHAAKQEN